MVKLPQQPPGSLSPLSILIPFYTVLRCCAVPLQTLGTLYLKVMFMPFFQPTFDDEDEEELAKKAKAKKNANAPPVTRAITHKVSDKMKVRVVLRSAERGWETVQGAVVGSAGFGAEGV